MLKSLIRRVCVSLGVLIVGCAFVSAQSLGVFEGEAALGDAALEGALFIQPPFYEITVVSSNLDGSTDNAYMLYKQMTGAFSIKAKIYNQSLDGSDGKAGLMIRDSLNPTAANAFGYIRSDLAYTVQWRETNDGVTERPIGFGDAEKIIGDNRQQGDIELERFGTSVNYYYYTPGGDRVLLHHQVIPDLSDPVFVGVAVASNGTGATLGEFDQLAITQFPFAAVRTMPAGTFKPGDTVSGIQIAVTLDQAISGNLTVTETIPAGWTVASSNPQGTFTAGAEGQPGTLTWTVGGGAGTKTFTYSLVAPTNLNKSLLLSGTVSGGGATGSIGGASRMQIFIPFVQQIADDFNDGDITTNTGGIGSGWLDVSQGGAVLLEEGGNLKLQSPGWNIPRLITIRDAFDFWNASGVEVKCMVKVCPQHTADEYPWRGLLFGLVSTKVMDEYDPTRTDHAAAGVHPAHTNEGLIYIGISDYGSDGVADFFINVDSADVPEPDMFSSQLLSRGRLPNWNPLSGTDPLEITLKITNTQFTVTLNKTFEDVMGNGLSVMYPEGALQGGQFDYGAYVFFAYQVVGNAVTNNDFCLIDRLEAKILEGVSVDAWALY